MCVHVFVCFVFVIKLSNQTNHQCRFTLSLHRVPYVKGTGMCYIGLHMYIVIRIFEWVIFHFIRCTCAIHRD